MTGGARGARVAGLRSPGPARTRRGIRIGVVRRTRPVTIDIDSLIQRSGRLQVDDIEFDAFRSQPLDAATLRCLRYMHDVEGHTACYMRDLLATRAHRDPEITAFLACWCYEEHWHGEAIAEVLRAHDEPAGLERLAAHAGASRAATPSSPWPSRWPRR